MINKTGDILSVFGGITALLVNDFFWSTAHLFIPRCIRESLVILGSTGQPGYNTLVGRNQWWIQYTLSQNYIKMEEQTTSIGLTL